MPRSHPRFPVPRRGLTLVEVLVIVAVLASLLLFLLPTVSRCGEAMRRTQCLNNLKQISLATQNYATVWGGFPAASRSIPVPTVPGSTTTTCNPAPLLAILPYLESNRLYQAINFQVPMAELRDLGSANSTVAATRIIAYQCPSDSLVRGTDRQYGGNSYRASLGTCAVCADEGQGAFRPDQTTPASDFFDGTATTLAWTERSVSSLGPFDPRRDWFDTHATTRSTADEWVKICSGPIPADQASFDLGQTWLIAGGMQTHVFTALPPNPATPDCGSSALAGGYGAISARSDHPGGVNVAMADGSVRWLNQSITLDLWRALGTRSGCNSITDQQY